MTADTSVVVAAFSDRHPRFADAKEALDAVRQLPGHVVTEVYSVLTRLPSGAAIPAVHVASALAERFPGEALTLTAADRGRLAGRLAAADIFGGATYDGLVALEALAHGETILTLDQRARGTYARLGVEVRWL